LPVSQVPLCPAPIAGFHDEPENGKKNKTKLRGLARVNLEAALLEHSEIGAGKRFHFVPLGHLPPFYFRQNGFMNFHFINGCF